MGFCPIQERQDISKTIGAISMKVTFLDLLRPNECNESKNLKKFFLSFLEKIFKKVFFASIVFIMSGNIQKC